MVGGMPVRQLKHSPSDKVLGKRKMSELESIDKQSDKALSLPTVFGYLLNTAYMVQDPNNALEYAKSVEDGRWTAIGKYIGQSRRTALRCDG